MALPMMDMFSARSASPRVYDEGDSVLISFLAAESDSTLSVTMTRLVFERLIEISAQELGRTLGPRPRG